VGGEAAEGEVGREGRREGGREGGGIEGGKLSFLRCIWYVLFVRFSLLLLLLLLPVRVSVLSSISSSFFFFSFSLPSNIYHHLSPSTLNN